MISCGLGLRQAPSPARVQVEREAPAPSGAVCQGATPPPAVRTPLRSGWIHRCLSKPVRVFRVEGSRP